MMSDETRQTQNGAQGGQAEQEGSGKANLKAAATTTTTTAAATNGKSDGWQVKASSGAMNTSNPIREIIETMNLSENPNKKVIPLSIGDPTIFGNLKPCKEIVQAVRRAEQSGKFYGYQTAAGLESAREAVAKYHQKCTGLKVKSQDVILASGCSHAIDLCICVLAHTGQNILIPRPGFPLYKTLTAVYGVKYKQYNLLADKNWSIDLKHLESLIDENTVAIIVNNPSNPCGSVFSETHLREILELADRYRLPIIADEIYDKLVFAPELYQTEAECERSVSPLSESVSSSSQLSDELDDEVDEPNDENRQPVDGGATRASSKLYCIDEDGNDGNGKSQLKHVPFKSLAELSESVPILTCGGISKTCLIPGVRLGWIIINDKMNHFDVSIRQGLGRLTQRLMGPNSLIQGALQEILSNVPKRFYEKTMKFIFVNANLCYNRLRQVKGLQPFMPQGSMYLMVRFDPRLFPTIDGDLDFTSKLMNEESVLVLPGKCFDFPNYFRICLTVPTNIMDEALNRIEEFCLRKTIDKPIKSSPEVAGLEFSDRTKKCSVDRYQLMPKHDVGATKTKRNAPTKQALVGQKFLDQKLTITVKSPFEWSRPNNNMGSQRT